MITELLYYMFHYHWDKEIEFLAIAYKKIIKHIYDIHNGFDCIYITLVVIAPNGDFSPNCRLISTS